MITGNCGRKRNFAKKKPRLVISPFLQDKFPTPAHCDPHDMTRSHGEVTGRNDASKALSTGQEYSRLRCQALACKGSRHLAPCVGDGSVCALFWGARRGKSGRRNLRRSTGQPATPPKPTKKWNLFSSSLSPSQFLPCSSGSCSDHLRK